MNHTKYLLFQVFSFDDAVVDDQIVSFISRMGEKINCTLYYRLTHANTLVFRINFSANYDYRTNKTVIYFMYNEMNRL